jgi:beta-lactamase superfamily II metal-dependent hydrolase
MSDVTIHVFNVKHGDSIVVEFTNDGIKEVIIIDCSSLNLDGKTTYPAYDYIKNQGYDRIKAILITHFHEDHLRGIEKFLDSSVFEIDHFYIPPVFSFSSGKHDKRLSKLSEKIKESSTLSWEPSHIEKLNSYAKLIRFIKDNPNSVEEICGPSTILPLSLCIPSKIEVLLPLPSVKGAIGQKIESGDYDITHFKEMNEVSVVLSLSVFDKKFIFGADSTLNQWNEHERRNRKYDINDLSSDFIKISHHGSKDNNNTNLYKYLFGTVASNTYAFISANGKSHPNFDVLKDLYQLGIKPRCTNLCEKCTKHSVEDISLMGLSMESANMLQKYKLFNQPIKCQGNMQLKVTASNVIYRSETGIPCPYV